MVLTADHAIAYKAIELLKDIFTNISPKLQQEQVCVYLCACYLFICVHVQFVYVFVCVHVCVCVRACMHVLIVKQSVGGGYFRYCKTIVRVFCHHMILQSVYDANNSVCCS